jgi:hypothetical protein
MKATSNSRSLETSIVLPYSSIILSVYFLKSLKISSSLLIATTSLSAFEANLDSFSIRLIKMLLMSTLGFKLLVVVRVLGITNDIHQGIPRLHSPSGTIRPSYLYI